MKKAALLVTLVLAMCLHSCTDKKDEPHAPVYPGQLTGVWINAGYLKNLTQNRSPKKALDEIKGYSEFNLRDDGAKNRLTGGVGINFHEGLGLVVHDSAGTKKGTFKAYLETGEYAEVGTPYVNGSDTMIVMYQYADSKVVDSTLFVKAPKGISQLLNKTVIAGTYSSGDKSISFSEDGKVTGFDSHSKYWVLEDLVINEDNEIIFDFELPTQKSYVFGRPSADSDTLNLYEMFEMGEEHPSQKGG